MPNDELVLSIKKTRQWWLIDSIKARCPYCNCYRIYSTGDKNFTFGVAGDDLECKECHKFFILEDK